ncbi:OLC1v1020057C1 [Oldenlandia corymbosa var. corymbosa]|nr:OLC1v1020057C1 [Oldenlandia corymbosa var. corymbosa]
MKFKIGEEVEVSIQDEGFENSYYEATIISKEKGSSKYQVRYKTLLNGDESGPMEEVVNADQLRPLPPQVPVIGFSLYEAADVYEHDGWWGGIIYGKFQSEYFLFHPATGEEKPYPFDKFRVHHEWRDDKWICHKAGIVSNPEEVKNKQEGTTSRVSKRRRIKSQADDDKTGE